MIYLCLSLAQLAGSVVVVVCIVRISRLNRRAHAQIRARDAALLEMTEEVIATRGTLRAVLEHPGDSEVAADAHAVLDFWQERRLGRLAAVTQERRAPSVAGGES